jgi:hypothetical protein
MNLFKAGIILSISAGAIVFCFFNPNTNEDFKEKTINTLSVEKIIVDRFGSEKTSRLVNEGFSKQTMKSHYKEIEGRNVVAVKNSTELVQAYGPFDLSDTPLIVNESGERYLLVKQLSEKKINPRNLLFSVEPGMYDVKIGIPNNEVEDLIFNPIEKRIEEALSSKQK